MGPPAVDSEALSGLVDSLEAPVVAVDAALAVAHLNDAAEGWLGRSRARLAGRALSTVGPHGPSLATLAARVLATQLSAHGELPGRGGPTTLVASPWWVGGRIAGVVLLAPNPTALGEGGERADLPALAAGLAHEVRNPLAAIRGAAELLASESGDERTREYTALILRETARVDALFARMLDFGRPLVLARRRFPLANLVHDLSLQARALAQARGARIAIEEHFDPALPPLVADRERLHEALVNLVKNAIEALPPAGGRLVIDAHLAPDLRRRDESGRGVPLVRLSIRDNGPGLAAARDRLFTPFFTTKAGGTGLGLPLARRTIEAHGGVLQLRDVPPPREAEPGAGPGGAEAIVLLPMESGHA